MVTEMNIHHNPAHNVLQEEYSCLVQAIGSSPDQICDSLFSQKLISKDIRNNVQKPINSNDDKARIIVNAVLNRVKDNSIVFSDFIKILKSGDLSTQEIAAKLEQAMSTVDEGTYTCSIMI